MSRIGKLPVTLPDGVNAAIANGVVEIQGPKGKLAYTMGSGVAVEQEDKQLLVKKLVGSSHREEKQFRSNYGSTRAHLNNMVLGVTQGWSKTLEMSGVGFTANLKGQVLVIQAGYSHDVELDVPSHVEVKIDRQRIEVSSHDKEAVGQLAAKIRKVHPPEPYLGKGIKYSDETVRRKAGKAGK